MFASRLSKKVCRSVDESLDDRGADKSDEVDATGESLSIEDVSGVGDTERDGVGRRGVGETESGGGLAEDGEEDESGGDFIGVASGVTLGAAWGVASCVAGAALVLTVLNVLLPQMIEKQSTTTKSTTPPLRAT